MSVAGPFLIDNGRCELMLYVDIHDAVQRDIGYHVVLGEVSLCVCGLSPGQLAQRLRLSMLPVEVLVLRGILIHHVIIIVKDLHLR